jgi:hypothetical protein
MKILEERKEVEGMETNFDNADMTAYETSSYVEEPPSIQEATIPALEHVTIASFPLLNHAPQQEGGRCRTNNEQRTRRCVQL